MKLAERLLLSLSHEPTQSERDDGSLETALSLLKSAFPGLADDIAAKRILDFGCGAGYQSAAMAMAGAGYVLGLDTNPPTLDRARKLAHELELQNVEFAERLGDSRLHMFDIVISQNSFEHFPDPAEILEQMKSALKPDGKILITFGPPWLSPLGSHMSFFTPVPWVNVLFSERTVMNVRSRYIRDGAMRYEDVDGGLNKMTVRKFEKIVDRCGLEVGYRRYQCVKRLNFLARLPIARELFVNHISCVLHAR